MFKSILFRIILMIFSTWIVINLENIFSKWYYTVIIIIYFLGCVGLKMKQKDLIRLLWDFAFINITIYGKELHHPMVFIFAIIPLINAINFSGKKSHLGLLCLLTLTTLLIQFQKIETWIIIPIFSLAMMYLLSMRRYREWEIDKNLTASVDSYFTDPSMLKPHQIYGHIIKELNIYFGFKENRGIQQIRTYILRGNTLWLVNASDFLWERTWELSKDDICILKQERELKIINNENKAYLFYITIGEIEYVFTCVTYKADDIKLVFYRFKDIMRLTFSKISTLLCTEYRITERREKKFNEIKDNVLYVNQAVKAMHFIRNKMTPLSNLIAYHLEVDGMSVEIRSKIESKLKREVKQASKDLTEILNYANYLLDKSKNPFHGTEIYAITIHKMYLIISEIAERHMGKTVEVDQSIKQISNEELYIYTNLIECKVMFTDWLHNMSKYSNGDEKISMTMDNHFMTIHFENICTLDDENLNRLIHDMNSRGKDAVLEGKDYGYGIYIIKSIANDFGVEIHCSMHTSNNNKILSLDFKFKTHERKEDSHL